VERAVQAARDGHAEALILAPGGFTILHRNRIIALAAKSRLPVISAWRIFADDGAILTYGPDIFETSRRVAILVDEILKGAKPADLPVEQPTRFELVVNIKTAKSLELTIPLAVLARADHTLSDRVAATGSCALYISTRAGRALGKLTRTCGWKSRPANAVAGRPEPSLAGVAVARVRSVDRGRAGCGQTAPTACALSQGETATLHRGLGRVVGIPPPTQRPGGR
jgi:ABC transporter substrate binding protein